MARGRDVVLHMVHEVEPGKLRAEAVDEHGAARHGREHCAGEVDVGFHLERGRERRLTRAVALTVALVDLAVDVGRCARSVVTRPPSGSAIFRGLVVAGYVGGIGRIR